MPLRPGLLQLNKWATGGPDANLAFSSLAPEEKKVYVRQVSRPRASQKARWMREDLAASGAALGSAVSSLIQQRAKVCEDVPVKSGLPDDQRDVLTGKDSHRQTPDDVESICRQAAANQKPTTQQEDKEVLRSWRGRALTGASQSALDANKRANEIRRRVEAASEGAIVEDQSDDDEDEDRGETAWSRVKTGGTRRKVQIISKLTKVGNKPKAKATAPGDPLLPEGHDLDSVASEQSLNRVESESWAAGRTLREGEDIGSRDSSSLINRESTPRPKTIVSKLVFSEDVAEKEIADATAREALVSARKNLADRFDQKSLRRRSSSSRSLKRPVQVAVAQRQSNHPRLLNTEKSETAITTPRTNAEPLAPARRRGIKLSPDDLESAMTNFRNDDKKKKQPNPAKPLPFKVLSWSSQKRGPQNIASNLEDGAATSNTRWETSGQPEHWLLLDLQTECEVCGCSLRFTGTGFDPKNVTLMRGGPDVDVLVKKVLMTHRRSSATESSPLDISLLLGGTWIVAQRSTLNSSANKAIHKLHFSRVAGRYWRLVFHESHSSTGNIRLLAPLQILGMPVAPLEGGNLSRRPSLTLMFTEAFNLADEERETRRFARQYDVPIDYAEYVRKEFARYDTSGTGALEYADFSKVVQEMVRQKASVTRIRDERIPESRIRKLWQNVDLDGSGFVEFGEFLLWFYNNFNSDSRCTTKSFHSNKMADTATEGFYASLGCNRLRFFASSQTAMEEAKARAAEPTEPFVVESFEALGPAEAVQKGDTGKPLTAGTRVKGKVRMRIFRNALDKDSPKPKKEGTKTEGENKTETEGENKTETEP